MTIPYALRLICVCLASFAIVFAVTGFTVSIFVPAALRTAERMRAASAARFILSLRLLPAALAAFTVAAICVPSFVRFEQRDEPEEVGMLCLLLVMFTAAVFAHSIFRTAMAWRRSVNAFSVLALVGIWRPRIVMSDEAREILSPKELDMALLHERAHASSRDNLKRFLIFFTPGAFPRFSSLEQAWKRFAEWAADDRATAGNPECSVSLAGALVQIAKLGKIGEPAPLATPFLAEVSDLEVRVDRLLNPAPAAPYAYGSLAPITLLALVLGASLYPEQVHELLEHLVH